MVSDTVPRIYLEERHTDPFKEGSLEIEGLLEGENYTYTYNASLGQLVITFHYQGDNGKVDGLKGTPGGHQIKVRLTTKVDQEWLQKGYETRDYEQNHTNTIALNSKSTTATVIFGKPGIEKSVAKAAKKGSFMYTVLLSGVSEVPVTIEDTFDTSLLEVDTDMATDPDHMHIAGGTQWSQIGEKTPVSYTDTPNGILLTADAVPMQENGHYYPYYRIVYYLKLKEGVDLEKLAVLNGGEHHLVNTAKWNGHETSCDYKTEYDYLDKKLLNEGKLGGTEQYRKVPDHVQQSQSSP